MTAYIRKTGIMIAIFTAFVVAGCAKHPPAAGPVAAPGDKNIIVAKVNGVGLPREALVKMMDRITISQETGTAGPPEDIRTRALEQLVLEELALQAAARQGLRIRQRDIDAAISYLVGHEQKDYEAFLAKQNKADAEFRSELERGMLVRLIFTREVIEKNAVSGDEVRKEYERQKDLLITPEIVSVVDLVLSSNLDDQASRKKAAEVIAQINADKDKNPWSLASDSAFIVRDLFLTKEKEPALYDAARKLKEGELSGAIKAGGGIHILKLSEYAPERKLSYEEVKDALEKKLKAEKLKKLREAWEQELKKDAKIEILDVPEWSEHKKL